MAKVSSGILLFRRRPGQIQILLVHPGGPLWKHKDDGFWSIPKGEIGLGEDPFAAAQREFTEETDFHPTGPFIPLTPVKLKSGKLVHAWACENDFDPSTLHSNTFTMEWPPNSGQFPAFPEVDRAQWFTVDQARLKSSPAQFAFIEELLKLLLRK